MEIRLLVRILAVAAAVLTIVSLAFSNLLYIPGLLVGLTDILIYRRTKPDGVRLYFYIALGATAAAFVIFVIEGILGFVFFINS